MGLISHYGQQGRNGKEEVIKRRTKNNENNVFLGTQNVSQRGFERALVPERSHRHTCSACGLRALAPPKSALSNGHYANVSRLPCMGCNTDAYPPLSLHPPP